MSEMLNNPLIILVQIFAVLVSLTVHEFAHAWSAKLFGDDTAEVSGRLSLNPLVHIDWIGTVVLPVILILFGLPAFGWAKPVPINPNNFSKRRLGEAVVSIAGPASNLVLIIIFAVVIKFLYPVLGNQNLLVIFSFLMIIINGALMMFNLIPIPPLDGSKVLFAVLPEKYASFKEKLEVNGPWILLTLLVLDSFLPNSPLLVMYNWALGWLNHLL